MKNLLIALALVFSISCTTKDDHTLVITFFSPDKNNVTTERIEVGTFENCVRELRKIANYPLAAGAICINRGDE